MRTELSDDAVRIRRYCAEDIPLLFEAARESVNEMFAWMPWCHQNYSLEESAAFVLSREAAWNQKAEFDFAILDVKTNRLLGGVSLNQFNREHDFANLGYWVSNRAFPPTRRRLLRFVIQPSPTWPGSSVDPRRSRGARRCDKRGVAAE